MSFFNQAFPQMGGQRNMAMPQRPDFRGLNMQRPDMQGMPEMPRGFFGGFGGRQMMGQMPQQMPQQRGFGGPGQMRSIWGGR